MAKGPRDRYQTCADLLVDLRAVRTGKNPPIAHKDIAGTDLAGLAQAEAAASAAAPLPVQQQLGSGPMVSRNLFIVMVALLVISVVVNVVLVVMRGGA
jgi:hypothetical protein